MVGVGEDGEEGVDREDDDAWEEADGGVMQVGMKECEEDDGKGDEGDAWDGLEEADEFKGVVWEAFAFEVGEKNAEGDGDEGA